MASSSLSVKNNTHKTSPCSQKRSSLSVLHPGGPANAPRTLGAQFHQSKCVEQTPGRQAETHTLKFLTSSFHKTISQIKQKSGAGSAKRKREKAKVLQRRTHSLPESRDPPQQRTKTFDFQGVYNELRPLSLSLASSPINSILVTRFIWNSN